MVITGLWVIVAAMAQPSVRPAGTSHRAYVQASLFASIHPEGNTISDGRIDQNLRGMTAALSVGGGAMVSRSVSLEGEFVYGGTVAAHQIYHHTITYDYTAESQQILLNGLARFRRDQSSHVEVVGGGGWGWNTERQTSVVFIDEFFRRSPSPDYSRTRLALTFTGGADFPIQVGPHAAVVPAVRVRWLKPLPVGEYLIGSTSAWTIEIGAGVRFR